MQLLFLIIDTKYKKFDYFNEININYFIYLLFILFKLDIYNYRPKSNPIMFKLNTNKNYFKLKYYIDYFDKETTAHIILQKYYKNKLFLDIFKTSLFYYTNKYNSLYKLFNLYNNEISCLRYLWFNLIFYFQNNTSIYIYKKQKIN